MAESNAGGKEGSLSKIIWMIIAAVVAALIGLPITYYITTPLTPKAELDVTSALNGTWFYVINVDKRLTVQDVWITFSFDSDRLNHILQESRPDDLCTKNN